MSGTLMHVGELATREMAELGETRNVAFDSAAADTARARGLSEARIREIFGYLPPPLFPVKDEQENAATGEPALSFISR